MCRVKAENKTFTPRKMAQPIRKYHKRLKRHHQFENVTTDLGISVEHCFRKGMKPFPALAPLPLVKLLTYIFAH